MPATPSSLPCLSAAERVRSIVATATSLDVVVEARRSHLFGRHTVEAAGQLTLQPPAGSRLARTAEQADGGELAAAAELTDLAPIAMRRRVRAQVTLIGGLRLVGWRHGADADPNGTAIVRLRVACAQLIEGVKYVLVDAQDLVTAVPDPLAGHEAAWLTHLVDAHPEAVDLLARLVPPRLLDGVRRVHPLRLDRFGITLRLEHPRADHDVRLAFPHPVEHPEQASAQVHALLHRARACPRRRLRDEPGSFAAWEPAGP